MVSLMAPSKTMRGKEKNDSQLNGLMTTLSGMTFWPSPALPLQSQPRVVAAAGSKLVGRVGRAGVRRIGFV